MDVSDPRLTDLRKNLIKILYFCRGGNVNVLTQYFNETLEYTEQQKKQMTNQLSRLKDIGIITSRKLEGKNSGSMYYLTPSGLELAKKLLDIYPMQQGEMWQKYTIEKMFSIQLRDYDYETYKPPIRQYAHHHLILQTIVSLFGSNSNLKKYPYRLTLDAYKHYEFKGESRILKPDLEVKIGKDLFTIEIDRSTESYTQLVSKFQNYKNYLSSANYQELTYKLKKVIFVYDDRNSNIGVSRRWETLMKAFLEGMGIKDDINSWPNLELLFINLRDIHNLISFIITIQEAELKEVWQETYFPHVVPIINEPISEIFKFGEISIIGKTEANSKLFFCNFYPCFSSNFYRDLLNFHQKGTSYFKSLEYYHRPELKAILIGETKFESWNLNLKNSKVDYNLQSLWGYLMKMVSYIINEK